MQSQQTEKEEDDEGPPPGWQPISTHPPLYQPQPPPQLQPQPRPPRPCGWGQMVCGSCHRLLSYPRGAKHVKCPCCETVNIVLEGITAKLEGDSNQADLFRQIRLQIITGEKEMVVENPPTNDQKVEVMETVRDLQPSPAEEKKHKRKEKPSQHNFPSQFPKRKRTSSSGNSSVLMSANLRMRDGLSISLTTSELEVVDNSNREALLESAKSDLANAQKRIDEMSHKESLLNKELDKLKREKLNLLTDCSSWETWCLQAENEEEEAKAKITQLKQDLSDMTSARADDRRKLASELFQLKKCLLAQHEEGFAKALRQAALLFKIPPDDDRFDVDQDVYHGKLVSINDIPYESKHC